MITLPATKHYSRMWMPGLILRKVSFVDRLLTITLRRVVGGTQAGFICHF